MAAVSCGVALLTLGFVAWAGLIYVGCGNYDSRCTASFWSNTDWALFRWQELGDYLTLFASAWLALGAWVARRAREEPA